MKKFLTTIALSLSAMLATSAMASPYNDHQDQRYHQQSQNHWKNDHRDNRYNNRINPSREWRSGQALPHQFKSSRYVVNYKNYRQLPKPNRNQQWLKVNGDYVLINERNHRIVRIIG